jgi:short-chain fatty acids transporter
MSLLPGGHGFEGKRRLIPDPIHFCLCMTVALIGWATFRIDAGRPHSSDPVGRARELFSSLLQVMEHGWFKGFSNDLLLAFSFQMSLIILTGSALAHLPITRRVLNRLAEFALRGPRPRLSSAWVVATVAVISGFLSWGFSLILSSALVVAIIQRSREKMRDSAQGADRFRLNFPLLAAAGYMGLLVWGGGVSSSVLLLANEKEALGFRGSPEAPAAVAKAHEPLSLQRFQEWISLLKNDKQAAGLVGEETWLENFVVEGKAEYLRLPIQRTLFHRVNIVSAAIMLVLVPLAFVGLALVHGTKNTENPPLALYDIKPFIEQVNESEGIPSQIVTLLFAASGVALVGLLVASRAWEKPNGGFEVVILLSLCLGLILVRKPMAYQKLFQEAGQEVAPILLQFPLYWGMYGILAMNDRMLVGDLANQAVRFMAWASGVVSVLGGLTPSGQFILDTYLTSCAVHLAVPSGGGQWFIQAPVSFAAAMEQQAIVDPARVALAIAYGNQTANMIQPFWVIPVVAFTSANAKSVLFYSAHLFIVALVIYGGCLLLA